MVRLALAQVNSAVGDIAGNVRTIREWIQRARALGADVVAFPELAITGYPPEDLLLRPDFVAEARRGLESVREASSGITVVVGTAIRDRHLYNSAAVLHCGELAAIYHKQLLPTYGVFDEDRYFKEGSENLVFDAAWGRLGVSVCEDIWYDEGPCHTQAIKGGARLLLNISASPFDATKPRIRQDILTRRAMSDGAFVAYCNLVGGQDELVFDGGSMVYAPSGELLARAAWFEEELLVVDLPVERGSGTVADLRLVDLSPIPSGPRPKLPPHSPAEEMDRATACYRALVVGTRDYARKNGFRKVALGLSGGVDSALTAVIAADALGPEQVTAVAMPTRFSSEGSLTDSRALATNLGIRLLEIPIEGIFSQFVHTLSSAAGAPLGDITIENLQPRIRGTLLMGLSNQEGSLVLTTGNKSESAVGYSTLYGDTAGGFAVIRDVPKLLVYELCRLRNRKAGYDLVPESILVKAPSAELRENQKDSDSLPEYEVLDVLIEAYVEKNIPYDEIVAAGFDPAVVRDVLGKIDRSEYKRRQSPPGVKITPRAFGRDWRLPISNRYRPDLGHD